MKQETLEAVLQAYHNALDGLADELKPYRTEDYHIQLMVGMIWGRNDPPDPEAGLVVMSGMFELLAAELESLRKSLFREQAYGRQDNPRVAWEGD